MAQARRSASRATTAADRSAEAAEPSPFSFDDYDNLIGFVISQAAYRLSQGLAEAIASTGNDVRPREFAILNRLHQHGRLTQTQLAALTYRDNPAISRMVDRLIALGYVKKTMSPGDRRAFLVSLTPAGRKARNAVVPLVVEMLEGACRDIKVRDLAVTVATLRKICA